MKCQECQEQISQLLDNELPKEALQIMFRHLAECEECRNFFVQGKIHHDAAVQLEYFAAPDEIDRKFSALGIEALTSVPTARQRTIAITTAVLSGIMAVMIGILSLILINNSVQDDRLSMRPRQFEGIYQQYTFDHRTLRSN